MGDSRLKQIVDMRITRVWRMRSNSTRIHYLLEDKVSLIARRLYEDEGSALYRALERTLTP